VPEPLNRRRSRPQDLPPNLASGLIFLVVLVFALVLILLNAGTLAAVATFIAAVVAAAAGAVLTVRNNRAGEGTVATGGAIASPVRPAVKLPPPGTMGPVTTAICSVLCQVAVVAALAAATIIAAYGVDPAAVSPPPVEELPAAAPDNPAGT